MVLKCREPVIAWRTSVTSLVIANDECLKLGLGSRVPLTEPFIFYCYILLFGHFVPASDRLYF